jgi:transposase
MPPIDESAVIRAPEIAQLNRRVRPSQDLRDRFIRYIQSMPGTSISSAARTYGIPQSTAHSIIRRMETTANMAAIQNRPQNCPKLGPVGLTALSAWIDERPDATLQYLARKLSEELRISVCNATLSKALNRIGFTIKLLRAMPVSRNCPSTVLARKQYAVNFLGEAPPDRRNIVWVDECGFNLHLRRKYGRARRGERASIEVANSRGQNISVCAGMSEDGFLHEFLRPGAFNAIHFCDFLTELFEKLREMGRENCWIILDNVRFHHSESIRCCTESAGHQLMFLPPYSPMLNPIESLFGKWKTLIRTEGVSMTRDTLLEKMASARYEISRIDCLGWIRDTNRNLSLSIQGHLFE